MKKQFFVAAMAVALGAGLTACSSDNLDVKNPTEVNQKASTYMSVSFAMPTGAGTRGLVSDDGQGKDNPDFKHVGKWEGQDKIEKVIVYVFNTTTNVLEKKQSYQGTQLAFNQKDANGNAVITPNSAFKVTPGNKKVYVVVNPTSSTESLLTVTEGTTTLASFQTAYESSNLTFAKPSFRNSVYTSGDETKAGEIARVDRTGAKPQDVILMTGESAEKNIEDNVSATQAVSGLKNRASLNVQRAVARVLVTTKAASYDVKGINPNNRADNNFVAAKIKNLTYVVAQGESKMFFQQKKQDPLNTHGAAYTTPAFDVKNGDNGYWTQAGIDDYIKVGKNYDYSGLWKNTTTYANIQGITVPTRAAFNTNPADEFGLLKTDLEASLNGEFVLPTLHKFVAGDRKTTGYRKGNTAYILVRGTMVPQTYVKSDGSISNTPLAEGVDYWLGANGLFYESDVNIQDPTKGGGPNQTAQKFLKGKVLYFLWLNPDDVKKAVNSPVIRNNIYHVQISAIGKIGANWNPLVPFPDPTPNPGENPINPNPNNPDPRPDNPLEPVTPPVDPRDPLSELETWMSVDVTILPWQVHSYEVEL